MASEPVKVFVDFYGRFWEGPLQGVCPICGQPDSIGDCNHQALADDEAEALGAINTVETVDFRRTVLVGAIIHRADVRRGWGEWQLVFLPCRLPLYADNKRPAMGKLVGGTVDCLGCLAQG